MSRILAINVLMLTLVLPVEAKGPDLFTAKRSSPWRVRPKADYTGIISQLVFAGRRPQRDTTVSEKVTHNRVIQQRTTTIKLPGFGNNQAGARSFIEVYNDRTTGNPVIRTVQRIKNNSRGAVQYRHPETNRKEWVAWGGKVPEGATKVKKLGGSWLNTVVIEERRIMATTPRARQVAEKIASLAPEINRAIKKGKPISRSIRRLFASSVLHKDPVYRSRSPSAADDGPNWGVGYDPIRREQTLGIQDPGGMVYRVGDHQPGINMGGGMVYRPGEGMGFGNYGQQQ
jgi:hypothetical protein